MLTSKDAYLTKALEIAWIYSRYFRENSISNDTPNSSPDSDKVASSHDDTGVEPAPPLCSDSTSKEKSVLKSSAQDRPSSKVQPPSQTKAAMKPKKGKGTQRTLTSIFAAKPKCLLPSREEEPKQLDTPTPEEDTTGEVTPPKLAPDREEQTVCLDVSEPELTGVEKFRQRLSQHLKTSPRNANRTGSTQQGGVSSIFSKETIVKAGDTPGMLV